MNYSQFSSWFKNFALLLVSIVFTSNSYAQIRDAIASSDTLIITGKDFGFYECSESTVPVFSIPLDSVLEFEIKTDFEKLFSTEESDQPRIEGTLSYNQNQNKIELPVSIKTRGKSRFAFCKYKPMDIKFTSTIDSTIFNGLKKFYLTTHCGNMDGDQWIFKGSAYEHKNRLLSEYYIYSMLEELETTTNSVSLCRIKYIDKNDELLAEEFGFIIEPYSNVAKRCNLIKDKSPVYYINESSIINTDLINYFITNYDWHYEYNDTSGWLGKNIKFLRSEKNIGYILPYDFDLNAIVYPDFWKNETESFDEHGIFFNEMLENQFSEKKKLVAPYQLLTNIPYYKTIINNSYLDLEYKEKFIYWLDYYEEILTKYLIQYYKYRRLIK